MATINVNVDEKVKEQAKETLEYLGTNFTKKQLKMQKKE